MSTFNAPSWEYCQVKRESTNTPLQALALLNDTTYVEAARKLAERAMAEGGDTRQEQLAYAFRLATGRLPGDTEAIMLHDAWETYAGYFQSDVKAARRYLAHGSSPIEGRYQPEELAAVAAVAGVILNLDETITKD